MIEPNSSALTTTYPSKKDREELFSLLRDIADCKAMYSIASLILAAKLEKIKSEGLFRALKGTRALDGEARSGTWTGFCETIGMSVDCVAFDIRHLKISDGVALEALVGTELFESDLKALREMSCDERLRAFEEAMHAAASSLIFRLENFDAFQGDE